MIKYLNYLYYYLEVCHYFHWEKQEAKNFFVYACDVFTMGKIEYIFYHSVIKCANIKLINFLLQGKIAYYKFNA